MVETNPPRLPKWPFLAGDLVLLAAAAGIYLEAPKPMELWLVAIAAACVVVAAGFGALPFVLEFRALTTLDQAERLQNAATQLQGLEGLVTRVESATGKWQVVQEAAEKTAAGARQMSDRMAVEVKSFAEFMEKANSNERATLKLETEKLRRAEAEWLQVVVRIMDHTFALHQGALRLGQPNVIQQIERFQMACRDTARRVGLTPFAAAPDEPFHPERHRSFEEGQKPGPEAKVQETAALGYSYQGQVVRPALVKVREGGDGAAVESAPATP